jgi:hypothetical protein
MKRVILFILLLIPFGSAHAIDNFEVGGLKPLPPYGIFSTFSAESLPEKKFGFGVTLERSVDPNFYRTNLLLAYGILDNLEVNATIPYVIDWKDSIDGFEDFYFAIKHRLIEEGKIYPAVAYLLGIATSNGNDNFSTDGGFGGGLILTKKVGPFKGHLNALYFNPHESGLRERYLLDLGAELAVTHNSKVLVEVVGSKDFDKNKLNLLEWRLGYRIAATDNIYTAFGAGFDIKDRKPDFRLLFSVSFILPKETQKIRKIYEE